ncbi:MAG: hypothetical protein CL398_07855 [Acidiferrobacteraceae bacterium]|nr:hypothetical protein [Acidiferrobacteraceae bacterium]
MRSKTIVSRVILISLLLGVGLYFFLEPLYQTRATYNGAVTSWIDFELPTTDESIWSSAILDKQVVVINFWAPWCLPCRTEIPYLIELHNRYYPSILVIGIAIDKVSNVRHFEDVTGLNYLSLVSDTHGMDLMRRYGTKGELPQTLIFDYDQKLRYHVLGPINMSELEDMLDKVM